MKLARLVLRLLIGGLFIGHGTQKLFGWFGGHGLEGTAAVFDQLGLKPGKRNALVAGAAGAAGSFALSKLAEQQTEAAVDEPGAVPFQGATESVRS